MRLIPLLPMFLLAAAAHGEGDQVLITYQAQVGTREVSGVSHALQWSATALGPDSAQVKLRVPIDSFDSGHREFDALLRAAAQSDRHPFVEVEGIAHGSTFDGTITLRGVSRPLRLELGLARLDGRLVVNASFNLDLSEFGIALPSAGRRLAIDFVGRFPDEPRAVISGGALSSAN